MEPRSLEKKTSQEVETGWPQQVQRRNQKRCRQSTAGPVGSQFSSVVVMKALWSGLGREGKMTRTQVPNSSEEFFSEGKPNRAIAKGDMGSFFFFFFFSKVTVSHSYILVGKGQCRWRSPWCRRGRRQLQGCGHPWGDERGWDPEHAKWDLRI